MILLLVVSVRWALSFGLIFRKAVDWPRLALGGAIMACALGLNRLAGPHS